jgi:acetyltransferase-like isoleucine patch superfamily enzyme
VKGIVIEDDVWIGAGARILDGVTIARGSVIGAGSVVTKSTQPYSIVVGVPAKIVSSRLANQSPE